MVSTTILELGSSPRWTASARATEMAAERLVTFEELRAWLAELDETRKVAERELAALRGHAEHILALERDRDALLDSLAPAQRHHWYKLLRLQAAVREDGTVKVSWAGGEGSTVL